MTSILNQLKSWLLGPTICHSCGRLQASVADKAAELAIKSETIYKLRGETIALERRLEEANTLGILAQLKSWRARWQPLKLNEDTDKLITRSFASTFSDEDGKAVLDYLIDTYYRPLVGGATALTTIDLAERNGQQQLVVDILLRVDKGLHPMAFEPEHSSDDEKEVDVRQ